MIIKGDYNQEIYQVKYSDLVQEKTKFGNNKNPNWYKKKSNSVKNFRLKIFFRRENSLVTDIF